MQDDEEIKQEITHEDMESYEKYLQSSDEMQDSYESSDEDIGLGKSKMNLKVGSQLPVKKKFG